MKWEIIPFIGMGRSRFAMSPADVAALIGPPESSDVEDEHLREHRAVELPIVSYEKDVVTEIEAFYDVQDVTFRGRSIFGEPGLAIMQFLEQENAGARMNGGTVLFKDIGIMVVSTKVHGVIIRSRSSPKVCETIGLTVSRN